MSDDAATVVWIDPGPLPPRASKALAGWAEARGVRLRTPDDSNIGLTIDLTVAERIEKALDQAREAIAANDAPAADKAIGSAQALVSEHPELPQMAWLAAEVERTVASRALRITPVDEARAAAAWASAHRLDGGRAFGIGEKAFPTARREKVSIAIAHDVPSAQLTVYVDGRKVEGKASSRSQSMYTLETEPGRHQVLAMIDQRITHASWEELDPKTPTAIEIKDVAACTGERLEEVRRSRLPEIDASRVACGHWIAVAPASSPDAIKVARCERDSCGPFIEWRNERLTVVGPAQPPMKPYGLPGWAAWALVGVGAASAATITMIATGVFEPRPVETRFVVGGARQE